MALDGSEPEVPAKYRDLRKIAEEKGYSDFWYSPEYGLFGTHPDHKNIEDERIQITAKSIEISGFFRED